MNYQMEVFHEQLIQLINNSGLTVGAAYFIVKDCLHELEVGYHKAIFNERNSSTETTTEEIPLTNEVDESK